jgi:hypothetical protein
MMVTERLKHVTIESLPLYTNILIFHYQQKKAALYFASAGDLVYCIDIDMSWLH